MQAKPSLGGEAEDYIAIRDARIEEGPHRLHALEGHVRSGGRQIPDEDENGLLKEAVHPHLSRHCLWVDSVQGADSQMVDSMVRQANRI